MNLEDQKQKLARDDVRSTLLAVNHFGSLDLMIPPSF